MFSFHILRIWFFCAIRREILPRGEVWKPQTYFVYFKIFKLKHRGKRSGEAP